MFYSKLLSKKLIISAPALVNLSEFIDLLLNYDTPFSFTNLTKDWFKPSSCYFHFECNHNVSSGLFEYQRKMDCPAPKVRSYRRIFGYDKWRHKVLELLDTFSCLLTFEGSENGPKRVPIWGVKLNPVADEGETEKT